MFDPKVHAENQFLDLMSEGVFDSMAEVLPKGEQGVAKIDHFTMSYFDVMSSLHQHDEEYVPSGTYARLKVNGELMMTDTPMEKRTNLDVVEKARGRVLIAGLGLGMILRAIAKKPEVTHITVLEKYQDVVDLVLPQFTRQYAALITSVNGHKHVTVDAATEPHPTRTTKLEVITADVFQWEPPADTPKYNTIYFDIWPESKVKYLPEMDALYKRYRRLLARNGWISSWTYQKLKKKKADDEKFLRGLPAMLDRHRRDWSPEEFSQRLRALLLAGEDKLTEDDKRVIREWAAQHNIPLS